MIFIFFFPFRSFFLSSGPIIVMSIAAACLRNIIIQVGIGNSPISNALFSHKSTFYARARAVLLLRRDGGRERTECPRPRRHYLFFYFCSSVYPSPPGLTPVHPDPDRPYVSL